MERLLIGYVKSCAMQFREANLEDEELIYRWSNDPVVRASSYNQEPIEFKNHQKWFRSKLNSDESCFLICSVEHQHAALVRFELDNDHWVIGVLMEEAFRGKGLSSRVILGGTEKVMGVRKLPVYAYIKKSNFASVKAFEKAGYKLEDELNVQSVPSYLYVWK